VHPCLEGIAHEYYGRFKPTLDHARNLLKQIWNERRSNAFLWMELFVVFVILWYIVDVVYVTLSIYNLPMGFDIENTYVLRFERMTSKAAAYQPGRTMKEDVADLHEIVNRLAHRPDVEAVSLSQNCIPYNDGANSFFIFIWIQSRYVV
jgi:hypothetical protein